MPTTSKNTSVNTVKLPAIYNKINWDKLYCDWLLYWTIERFNNFPILLDIGCGKETKHIKEFLSQHHIQYYGYDKYWGSDENWDKVEPDIVICSNVLNVIEDKAEMEEVHNLIKEKKCCYFITVYEGDKTGIGKITKKDCYQRNEKLRAYQRLDEITYKNVLTQKKWKKYLQEDKKHGI